MNSLIGISQEVNIRDKQWMESFRENVFSKINVESFLPLFQDSIDSKKLKALVMVTLLMEMAGISEDEAVEAIEQNEFCKADFGLYNDAEDLVDDVVDLLIRVNSHFQTTGEDLIKDELDRIALGTQKLREQHLSSEGNLSNSEHKKRVARILQLASRLVEAIPKDDEKFLWELLELALKNIPEADYGSISILDADTWRYAAAKGHNWDLLKQIPLKPQYSQKYEIAERKQSANIYIIEQILQADSALMPGDVHKLLIEASKPIKQSLIAEICFNGKCKGHICIDIAAKSPKNFQESSKPIIKSIGDLAAAYLMMRESYSMVDNLESIIRLSGKLVYSAENNDESFLSELLKIALEQIKEADYGSVSVVKGDAWRFIDAKGHDIEALKAIKLTKKNMMDFSRASKGNELSSVNIEILENITDFAMVNLDKDTYRKLESAFKKSKQVLLAQFNYRDEIAGYISVGIGESSHKTFSTDAERVIGAFGNLASAFIAFQRLSELQQQMQQQIQQKLLEAGQWNRQLEQKVSSRTMALRNLLDNVGQGLMTFGSDCLIHKDYSQECSRIFGGMLEGRAFSNLIFPEDKEESDFVDKVLQEVFDVKDQSKVGIYLSMLPSEIKLDNKFINLEYKLIDNTYNPEEKALMVIFTEITEKKQLENKLKADESIIRMVANVAANAGSFLDCVKEFQYFYGSKVHEILDSNREVSEMYADIYREIHTFKGSFGQFEMQNSVANLSSMESALSYIGNMISNFTVKDLRAFVYSFDIIDFLNNDIDMLKEKLGTNLFHMGESIHVDKLRLSDIEREIMDICSPVECRALLPMVKSLRYKSLKELLGAYPEYTMKLAERLEKPINVFSIEGEDIYVDGDKYGSFIKSLGHVFRNSVDHGFEVPDASKAQNIDKIGNICCRIDKVDNFTEIVIEDDGEGVDFEKIRNKVIEIGLYNKKQASLLDEDTLIELIFRENFSTKDFITDVSGRGMGLSAVKTEVLKLGGRLEVSTQKGRGTKLRFLIPLMDAEHIKNLAAADFAEPLLNTTIDFLQERFQDKLEVFKVTPFNSGSFDMKNYTAFISIKGLFDGSFVISMDKRIAASLLHRILLDNIEPQSEVKYTKDVIAECANMILGNSIKSYPNIQELIIIGTPKVIYSPSEEINYDGDMITGYILETSQGNAVISIIQ